MAESTVQPTSAAAEPADQSAGLPSLAVVLLATGTAESLRLALDAVLPTCRESGVRLRVVWAGTTFPLLTERGAAGYEVMLVDPALPVADRRQAAAVELDDDIIIFVEDGAPALIAWGEMVGFRLGYLKRGANRADWSAVLDGLNVPRIDGRS